VDDFDPCFASFVLRIFLVHNIVSASSNGVICDSLSLFSSQKKMQHAACSALGCSIFSACLLDVSHEFWSFCSKLLLEPNQFIDRMSVSSVLFGIGALFKITEQFMMCWIYRLLMISESEFLVLLRKVVCCFWIFYRLSRLMTWTLFRGCQSHK
jgi:hypothetical protein